MNAARQIILKKMIQFNAKSFKLMIFNVEKKKRKTAENLSNCIQASSKIMRKVERLLIISIKEIEQQLISMQFLQKQTSKFLSFFFLLFSFFSFFSSLFILSSNERKRSETVFNMSLCSQNSETCNIQSNEEKVL
jgi:hypothetical protein